MILYLPYDIIETPIKCGKIGGINMKFLVIEDNATVNRTIRDSLSKLGDCDHTYDGAQGLYLAQSNTYDLVTLEILLPKKNGIEILQEIRKKNNCPVIMISAIGAVEKKIEALRAGADDYMVKPFDKEELAARAEAVLRRYNNNFHTKYVHGNIELDFAVKMLKIDGEYIPLSGKLYEILEYLVRSRNIIIPKEQLFNRIWGFDSETVLTVVEVYMSKLRKTLSAHGCSEYLRTIKNVGYMWKENAEEILEK